MHLSPHEQERLLVFVAADVASRRRERGHRLNHPEAVAVLTAWVFEAARDGRSVAEIMGAGREVLSADDVMDGVGHLIEELQVEATFPDGTKLVTLHGPIQPGTGTGAGAIVPGEVLVADEPIALFEGRGLTELSVVNDGDRPVQVGSHFHFAEANEALTFDRGAATGRRLAVPAGTSVRFEPGVPTTVLLVDLAGAQIAAGFRGLHGGAVTPGGGVVTDHSVTLDRARYAALYGPTVGDRVRLADTDLLIRIEADLCGGPGRAGEEAVFGGGKVIRESMGQSGRTAAERAPDLVITGAIVLDHWGIVKADVGVRDGRIVALGKAGNPDTMDGVHPDLVIGPSTEIIAGNGKILTAGAIDSHVHLICPQIMDTALASGTTTIIGGGTGPAEGTKATTVTASPFYLHRMLESLDTWPVNVALLGKGNTVSSDAMWEQLRAGASGFKLHEDWGSTPAAIAACLDVCDAAGVQAALHTDTLNEAGFVETTLAAIAGRSIHAYHTEGAGGGHAPDIITVASQPNVLPSSTNPTRPHTVNTVEEHLDMLIVCHHLNPAVPEDLAFAESRIRPSTIAAEDVLHDLGAISMIGSDSQAMGRVGEVVIRTWQTAHAMKLRRGPLEGDTDADNARAKRYVAKYTICPAVAHGLDGEVGSVEVGKLADLVLYDPRFFGVRPHLVVKGGMIAMAQMGDANASIPTPQPVMARPMFGAVGATAGRTSVAWVAPAAIEDGLAERLELARELVPVKDCRSIAKADMVNNTACPDIRVDADSFEVSIDGEVIEQAPVSELPLAQRYFIF